MTRLIIALVICALAVVVSLVLRRRRPDPPAQSSSWTVPQQLDRADFSGPAAPWLVAVFASSTCNACASVVTKAEVLRCAEVAVEVIEHPTRADLHKRYGIDAVPTIVIADAEGVVRSSFVGPVSATDLWAAVAELREPGSTPPPEAHTH